MSRTIFHTIRQLNPEQEKFIISEINGNPVAPKAFKKLDRRFKRRFGAGINSLLVNRLLKRESRRKAEVQADTKYHFWKQNRAG